MPSWNVHTAHVERLLAEEDPETLGIRDINCFLFGNYVPDIYAGWMVPVDHRIDYKTSHWSEANSVATPQVERFWLAHVRGGCSDLTIGALCHLICDRVYNAQTRDWAYAHNVALGNDLRIRKQADFDYFGHSFDLSLRVRESDELLRQCAAFPQYRIEEKDVRAAIAVAHSIVETNREPQSFATDHYIMLDHEFFEQTFELAHICMRATLHAHAQHI